MSRMRTYCFPTPALIGSGNEGLSQTQLAKSFNQANETPLAARNIADKRTGKNEKNDIHAKAAFLCGQNAKFSFERFCLKGLGFIF